MMSTFDDWKTATPPEYEREEPADVFAEDSVGSPRPNYATAMDGAPCPIPRGGPERTTVNAAEPAPATGQFEEEASEAPAAGSPEEPQLPCPHARSSWRLCPWCLSINLPVDPDVTW